MSGGVSIAYQVVGEGPLDLVMVPGWVSNLDVFWEEPAFEHFLRRLASFSRLILFDKRGTGLSDRVVDLPSLDRGDDPALTAHRIFWGLPPGATRAAQAARPAATVTELAFIDDSIADGHYLLNLQVAPFVADAAPSRPILLPLTPS